MNNIPLTAKYRPQLFADVAGQSTLKTILSRASQEDRVAPAYLFSGTRGVGKTTLARIFAKALNCRNAPAAEPCNACDQCHAVTMGSAVDVVEIDGASNRGIDDVRRLKEVVGYAPMEGRYKIFIIDEAHMLSREAFNALLKTLEEPPTRVTFIMATTEPHKFPPTIISRCQHYVFKRLPESELITHLSSVLKKEGISFQPSALQLIARRGAGSVRDAMSLLGQVLALGDCELTEDTARGVLGLASQEALFRIAETLCHGNTLPLVGILHELLDQGLDIGFFLRELAGLWRNLFILAQSGEAGLFAIDVPKDQGAPLLELSRRFSLSHIHASWQMTLEGQRRVLTSLEPGLALELLLMNLAMLPQLLSLDGISSMARRSGGMPKPPTSYSREASFSHDRDGSFHKEQGDNETKKITQPAPLKAAKYPPGEDQGQFMPSSKKSVFDDDAQREKAVLNIAPQAYVVDDAIVASIVQERVTLQNEAPAFEVSVKSTDTAEKIHSSLPMGDEVLQEPSCLAMNNTSCVNMLMPQLHDEPEWSTVLEWCVDNEAPGWFIPLARNISGAWLNGRFQLQPKDEFGGQRIMEAGARAILDPALEALCGSIPPIDIIAPDVKIEEYSVIKEKIYTHPVVKKLEDALEARIIDFGQIR